MNRTETAVESNFEDVATEDFVSDNDADFEFVKITEREKETIASNCPYIHFEHASATSKRPILQRLIRENDGQSTRKKRRDRKITSASTLSNARLPFPFA